MSSKNALLVNYVRPVAAIAAAQLSQRPDFAQLRLPKTTGTPPVLLAAANAMWNTAANSAPTFIAGGMAPTFLADFGQAVADLSAAVTARGNTKGAQVGATQGLAQQTKRGREAVKTLDALVDAQLASNPPLLAQWSP